MKLDSVAMEYALEKHRSCRLKFCANAQADLNLRLAHMFDDTLSDVAVQILDQFTNT